MYSLTPSLDRQSIIKALEAMVLRRVSVQIGLSPAVGWENMGIKEYENYLDVKTIASGGE